MRSLCSVGPEVRALRPELLVELGRTARLGCEVRGYPGPEIEWLKDETELVTGDKYRVDSTWADSSTAGMMQTFLEIREVF